MQTAKPSATLQFRAFCAAHRILRRSPASQVKLERDFLTRRPGRRSAALLKAFPGLTHLWSILITDWVHSIILFADHFSADRAALKRVVFQGRAPGRLSRITMNHSDPHGGGREVIVVHFEKGSVVYKPRDACGERAWFSLLVSLNRQGFSPAFRPLRILNRKNHSWMEHVAPEDCRTRREARDYFRRAGGLLCAAWALGLIDCHRDNLIAVGSQPILVDAETLCHWQPSFSGPASNVLRTGLLPVPRQMSARPYRVSPFAAKAPLGAHSSVRHGRILAPSEFKDDFLRGFRDVWGLLFEDANRRRRFRERLRRVSYIRFRRLHWPTRNYDIVRAASVRPEALRSSSARRRVIFTSCRREEVGDYVLREEGRACMRFDVPYFREKPVSAPSPATFALLEQATQVVQLALSAR